MHIYFFSFLLEQVTKHKKNPDSSYLQMKDKTHLDIGYVSEKVFFFSPQKRIVTLLILFNLKLFKAFSVLALVSPIVLHTPR